MNARCLSACRAVTAVGLAAATTALLLAGGTVFSAGEGDPADRALPAARVANDGRSLFTKSFTPAEGLGPEFNAVSCAFCHDTPAVGGTGTRHDTLVSWVFAGAADMLGGPAQRLALVPSGATIRTSPRTAERRKPPALFGLGYLESIPLQTLRLRSDAGDADRDGISGRLPWRDACFGRFGWQSSVCDIHTFVTGALSGELGIDALPPSRREISPEDIDDLAEYVRSLPPPPAAESNAGSDVFDRVGCSTCHTPVSGVVTLRGKRSEVSAYTDLLVHQMGAGPRHEANGSRSEFRTAPLWGIASTGPPYWHDGSATTLEQAIRRHAGEAEEARRAFMALSRAEYDRLLAFVRSR